jgi:hypothetical protein
MHCRTTLRPFATDWFIPNGLDLLLLGNPWNSVQSSDFASADQMDMNLSPISLIKANYRFQWLPTDERKHPILLTWLTIGIGWILFGKGLIQNCSVLIRIDPPNIKTKGRRNLEFVTYGILGSKRSGN